MIQRNEGQIVSIASIAGVLGNPFLTDYSAAKFGCVGMMESLRQELKRNGHGNIVCTTVMPYFINTGMFDGTKCSIFFPFLEQDTVVRRIVYGILQNENEIYISWHLATLIRLMKLIFPAAITDPMTAFLNGDAMGEFRGRQNQIAQQNTNKNK